MPNSIVTLPYEIGRLYNRRADIHQRFGGQQRGGISTPKNCPYIFLFTGEGGEQHGYSDGWNEDGVFLYFGEGQQGDMTFVRGNRAVRDHASSGRDLLLFQGPGHGRPVRFVGQFSCASWEHADALDTDGVNRKAIVFHLIPDESVPALPEDGDQSEIEIDLATLRERALSASSSTEAGSSADSRRRYYKRSKAVRDYVLARANGRCECCGSAAPFIRRDGSHYLEPHHIQRRSDFGPDHPRWVAGICPNCHREIHFGADGQSVNSELAARMKTIEPSTSGQ